MAVWEGPWAPVVTLSLHFFLIVVNGYIKLTMLAISKCTVQSVGVSSGILLRTHHHRAFSELTLSVFFKIFFFFYIDHF